MKLGGPLCLKIGQTGTSFSRSATRYGAGNAFASASRVRSPAQAAPGTALTSATSAKRGGAIRLSSHGTRDMSVPWSQALRAAAQRYWTAAGARYFSPRVVKMRSTVPSSRSWAIALSMAAARSEWSALTATPRSPARDDHAGGRDDRDLEPGGIPAETGLEDRLAPHHRGDLVLSERDRRVEQGPEVDDVSRSRPPNDCIRYRSSSVSACTPIFSRLKAWRVGN